MLTRSFEEFGVVSHIGETQRRRLDLALRNESAELVSAFQDVLCFRTIQGRTVERCFDDLFIRKRYVEARTKLAQLALVQFLLLVGDIASLAGFTQPVSFDRLCQYDGWGTFMVHRGLVRGIDFFRVMAAPQQLANLVIGQMIDHLEQRRILAKEMFAGVTAGLNRIFLVVAVHCLLHAFYQQPVFVCSQKRIPIRAPDNFDDIPSGATKSRFQFLNDLAIASHRAIETLQVAVYYPDEIVQIFPACQGERARGFRLIHLAVTDETPNPGFFCTEKAAALEITIEAGLIYRHDRSESHGHGGELPKVRNQIRMRIGG